LGKSAKDLFNKGYAHGFLNFDSTTKSGESNGANVEFKTNATHNLSSQKLGGRLEVKYKVPQHGVTITEKWNTENTLSTAVEVKDQFTKGLTIVIDTSYVPHNAKRSGLIKTEWAGDTVKINSDLNLSGNPMFTVGGVMAHQDWLFGAQTRFDISTNELKNTSVTFGRLTPEYSLHSYTNDGVEFGASWYHKVHKNLELGAQLGWTAGDSHTRFGLASKYRIHNDLTVKAKVDNKSNIAVSAIHDLSPAVKLTLSAQFGLVQSPNDPNKFGAALEYSPACCH
jgi:hypothetical protein